MTKVDGERRNLHTVCMAGEPAIAYDVVVVSAKAASRAALSKALTDADFRVVATVDRGEVVPATLIEHHPDLVVVGAELAGRIGVHETLARVAHVLPTARRIVIGRSTDAGELAEATVAAGRPAEVVVAARNLIGAGASTAGRARRTRTAATS